jgi:ABC-2 type transport system ATP-binding protein
MLLGLTRPTSGELRVLGLRPDRLRRGQRDRLGYSPQLFALSPDLSVGENLTFAASLYGMSWSGRSARVRRVLELVELTDSRSKVARDLSGGMQKRLQLAAALVHDPELIFLDEPTAGIDPVLRAAFWQHFRELRDAGRTLIVTTQYVGEAEYCDGILALRNGRIAASGSPAEVRRRAIGGDVVHVSGPDLDTGALIVIHTVRGVRQVRRLVDGAFEVIVDDAGPAVPALLHALQAAGIDVDEVEEQHPSFDEVFVRLMGTAEQPDG